MDKQPHLLVFLSAHGFGHVAQTAPVLNALRKRIPGLRLTVRSMVPPGHLRSRIDGPFELLPAPGDIGMLMSSALDVRAADTAEAYHALHCDWDLHVTREAQLIRKIAPDFVLSNIGYLPLAGAHQAGIPCAAMCSLNWEDIYAHYCGVSTDAARVVEQIHRSYANAGGFLRPSPGMAMSGLPNLVSIGPVASVGKNRRVEIDARLGLKADERLVLLSLGGIASRLPVESWPRFAGIRLLVQESWQAAHPDVVALESLEMAFGDILASSDALVCKPGYGSFAEAACSGVPLLYASRDDWPETPALTTWLAKHGVSREIGRNALEAGEFVAELETMWSSPGAEPVIPTGVTEAADWLAGKLLC